MTLDRWMYDDSGHYAYLMVTSSDETLSELRSQLAAHDFEVLAYGKSYRPASDGYQYKFYLRLGKSNDAATRDRIEQFVRNSIALADPAPQSGTVDYSDLFNTMTALRGEIRTLFEPIQDIHARLTDLNLVDSMLKQTLESVKALQHDQSRHIERTEQTIVKAIENKLGESDDLERLKMNLLEARDERAVLETMIQELQTKIEELQTKMNTSGADTTKPPAHTTPSTAIRHKAHLDYSKFLRVLLPKVDMLRGSEEVIFVELRDPENVLRTLERLAHEPLSVQSQRVQGANEWMKVNFSTGEDNSGRLYYRRNGELMQVLISKKPDQERDIRYLREC